MILEINLDNENENLVKKMARDFPEFYKKALELSRDLMVAFAKLTQEEEGKIEKESIDKEEILEKLGAIPELLKDNLEEIKEKIKTSEILNDNRTRGEIEKLKSLETKMDLLLGSSNKGQVAEGSISGILEEALPHCEIINCSKTPESGDLHIRTPNNLILVEIKNYKGNVPGREIDKFKRDIERVKPDGAILISIVSGISGRREKLCSDNFGDIPVVFLSKSGFRPEPLIAAVILVEALVGLQKDRKIFLDNNKIISALRGTLGKSQIIFSSVAEIIRQRKAILKLKDNTTRTLEELDDSMSGIENNLKGIYYEIQKELQDVLLGE